MWLTAATSAGRGLVSDNVRDFMALEQRYKALGRAHGGLVFISSKSFPQERSFVGAVVKALDKLLSEETFGAGSVTFLSR